MATKNELLRQYEAGRGNLRLIGILTAVNVVLALFECSWSFLFTAWFPYVRAVLAGQWMAPAAEIILCCVLPLALIFCCLLMSKNEQQGVWWLCGAAALFALDSGYLAWFIIRYGFDISYLLNILYHLFALLSLLSACRAGFDLLQGSYADTAAGAVHTSPEAGAFGSVQAASPAVAAAMDGSAVCGQGAVPVQGAASQQRIFVYDKQMAKQNGAAKWGAFWGALAAFMVGVPLLAVAAMALVGDAAGIAVAAVLIVGVAAFGFAMVRLSPFLDSKTSFCAVGDVLHVFYGKNSFAASGYFRDLVLVQQLPDRFVLDGVNAFGKRQRLRIPNAYPELDSYFAEIGIL